MNSAAVHFNMQTMAAEKGQLSCAPFGLARAAAAAAIAFKPPVVGQALSLSPSPLPHVPPADSRAHRPS